MGWWLLCEFVDVDCISMGVVGECFEMDAVLLGKGVQVSVPLVLFCIFWGIQGEVVLEW